jgi:hypothetical protein
VDIANDVGMRFLEVGKQGKLCEFVHFSTSFATMVMVVALVGECL